MDHIIGLGTRGISKGIAVASEVVAGRRRSSAGSHNNESNSDSEEDIMSREQDLDDAIAEKGQESGSPEREKEGADAPSVESVTNSFTTQYQGAMMAPATIRPLPQTVILPQRRPKQRSRGFIRAYAPLLGECSGISQDMFMDFLTDFDKAAKAWPIFNVINMAAFGIGMVPHAPFIAASIAMNTVASIGEELQTRYKANEFLDNINDVMFKPRKLYALIMTYRPDMSDDALLRADMTNPQSVALSKALDRDAGNSLNKKLARFRVSSGKTTHDSQIPDPAPLIYPALDQAFLTGSQRPAITAGPDQPGSSSNALVPSKSKGSIVQDYLDRRAQAQLMADYPDSKLTSTLPPQQKKFVNRFADPDHPVNSGSIFGLLSGGTWDPIASGRVSRAERKARKKGEEPLTTEEKHDAYMGRKVRGRVTGTPSKDTILGIKKIFGASVLYLVITNLPEGDDAILRE